MCGIVGLFIKDRQLQPELGRLMKDMLVTMTDRGPDSAGIAVYRDAEPGRAKVSIQSDNPGLDFRTLEADVSAALNTPVAMQVLSTHAILSIPSGDVDALRQALARLVPDVRVMGIGERLEIFKEIGLPGDVVARFGIETMSGTHAIGHTRMATESAVTTLGAHPFNTGTDQCLVHNGSLSNHNSLRRKLRRQGVTVETDNDTEVAAAYLTWRMQNGDLPDKALEACLEDLDGFYTFVVGTKHGFGVLRDPIACKPAVLAETDQFVAFGSEYRALVGLPGIETARVWEPEPATAYFWSHETEFRPSEKAA